MGNNVLWLKQKADKRYFCAGKEQTYVWNPLLLRFTIDDYG
jgi:hypothetical protein